MSTNYARGANRERQAVELLRAQGWVAHRTPKSGGAADVIANKSGCLPRFVQVKTDKAGPYGHFGPAARKELIADATKGGGIAFLLYWPPNAPPRWLTPDRWPRTERPSQ